MFYVFDIVTSGKKIETDDDLFDVCDALYEAGCGDSSPHVSNGVLCLPFDRESDSYEKAVISAITDIEKVEGLKCVSVDVSGIVSLSDAAELSGLTKAALSRYANGSRGNGDFPKPMFKMNGNRPMWSWSEVADWLMTNEKGVSAEVAKQAKITEVINAALSIRNTNTASAVLNCLDVLTGKSNISTLKI